MPEKYPNFDINKKEDSKFLEQLSKFYRKEGFLGLLKEKNYENVWLATINKFEETKKEKKERVVEEKVKALAKYIRERNKNVEWKDEITLEKGHFEALYSALLEQNRNFDFTLKNQEAKAYLEELLKRGDSIDYWNDRGKPDSWIALAKTISKEIAIGETGTRLAAKEAKKPKNING